MVYQDANSIPAEVKRLQKRQLTISQIIKLLFTEYNCIGKDIIRYEANEALRISKTNKNIKDLFFTKVQIKKTEAQAKKIIKSAKAPKESRSGVFFVDTKSGRTVRSKKLQMLLNTPVRTLNKKREESSKILRTKLQRTVQLPQLPAQSVPGSIHKLVHPKARTKRIPFISRTEPSYKKVVTARVRRINKKI